MASTTTNVDYYAAGFDSAGRRVCSLICDFNPNSSKNADKITALLNKVKATSDDVDVAEIITSDYFNEYLNGKVRGSDGAPIDYIAPEPTAKEKKDAERAALETEYNSNKQDMLTALQAALLAGNDEAASSIKQDYKDMTEAYKTAVKEVG